MIGTSSPPFFCMKKKKYPTFINETVMSFEKAAVSGGVCGVTLLLTPSDLLAVTDALACDLV